jgi:HD-like signal output (HDOD) protein
MSIASAKSGDLHKLLSSAQLPALPHSAIKIIELARDPENGPPEYAAPIEVDPGLTGQVLRFVNSSYFGFSNEISSVKLALALVGVRTIKNFVLWSAVFSLMPNPRCGPFDLKRLWQDSLRRGLFARALAKLLGCKDAEEAFSAALLQDIGVPILAKELPTDYLDLLKQRDDGRRRLSELEHERFGWNHAQAGGIMARQWRLPEDFALLIEGHTGQTSCGEGSCPQEFQAAVSLSSLLPSSADSAWWEFAQFEQAYHRLPCAEAPSVPELLERIDTLFVEFAPLIKLDPATKTLVDYYQEAPAAAV